MSKLTPNLEIIPREKWGAQPPRDPRESLGEETGVIVATLNTETPPCITAEDCEWIVQQIQRKQLQQGFSDIQYNWQFQPIQVKTVLVMYTNTDTCLSNKACMKIVWRLQHHHIRTGLREIQWNFLIGECGRVYEGRGWDFGPAKNAIHSPWDYKSLDVAFKGSDMHKCMRDQLDELIYYGLQQNLIRDV